MLGLSRIIDKVVWSIDKVEQLITSLLLIGIVAINGAEIVAHSVFNKSLSWSFEITILFALWIYFLGICLVYYNRRDIILDFVDRIIPKARLELYIILVNVLSVIFLSILIYYGWILLIAQSRTKTMGLGIPNFYFSMPIVIGSVSMILILVKQSLDVLLGKPPPERDELEASSS